MIAGQQHEKLAERIVQPRKSFEDLRWSIKLELDSFDFSSSQSKKKVTTLLEKLEADDNAPIVFQARNMLEKHGEKIAFLTKILEDFISCSKSSTRMEISTEEIKNAIIVLENQEDRIHDLRFQSIIEEGKTLLENFFAQLKPFHPVVPLSREMKYSLLYGLQVTAIQLSSRVFTGFDE